MKQIRWLRVNLPLLFWQRLAASLSLGLSAGFFSYIFLLQTPAFSRRYLLFGIVIFIAASLAAYLLLKLHPLTIKDNYFISQRCLLLIFLLSFLALPSFVFAPPYPKLPFFQRESTLVITIRTGTEPVSWSQFRRIYLNSGAGKLGFKAFQIAGPWISSGDDFILQPKSEGQITWSGHVGRRASLAIPVPSQGLTITTTWDNEIRHALVNKSPYVQNKNFIAPLWYIGLIYLIAGIPLFFTFMMMDGFPLVRRIVLPALILGLSFVQTNLQFQRLGSEFHKTVQVAIQDIQLSRHIDVLNGIAPNPWQYRVLSEWIAEAFIYISARLLLLDHAAYMAFWGLRVLQNLILLSMAYLYFTRLGITKTASVYGIFLLAGGMLHVFHESDLSFNTYFDVIFYLLAGILILNRKYAWVPVLMVAAALNRETSAMIPVLLIIWAWLGRPSDRAKALISGLMSLFVWVLIFTALHLYYPNAPIFNKITGNISPGWELLRYNLSVPQMPILLFQTLGFSPLVAVITQRYWHLFVRICFLSLVPVWILVHAFGGVWAETRIFLVLLAVVFIPATLPLIDHVSQEIRQWAWGSPAVSIQSLLESQS